MDRIQTRSPTCELSDDDESENDLTIDSSSQFSKLMQNFDDLSKSLNDFQKQLSDNEIRRQSYLHLIHDEAKDPKTKRKGSSPIVDYAADLLNLPLDTSSIPKLKIKLQLCKDSLSKILSNNEEKISDKIINHLHNETFPLLQNTISTVIEESYTKILNNLTKPSSPYPDVQKDPEIQELIIKPKIPSDSISSITKLLHEEEQKHNFQTRPISISSIGNTLKLKLTDKSDITNIQSVVTSSLYDKIDLTIPDVKTKKCLLLNLPLYITEEDISTDLPLILNLKPSVLKIPKHIDSKSKETRHWIVELPLKEANNLLKRGKIFLYYRRIRIVQLLNFYRCYKCQRHGHFSWACNFELKCLKCASCHSSKECSILPTDYKCANCEFENHPNLNHSADSRSCPVYLDYKKFVLSSFYKKSYPEDGALNSYSRNKTPLTEKVSPIFEKSEKPFNITSSAHTMTTEKLVMDHASDSLDPILQNFNNVNSVQPLSSPEIPVVTNVVSTAPEEPSTILTPPTPPLLEVSNFHMEAKLPLPAALTVSPAVTNNLTHFAGSELTDFEPLDSPIIFDNSALSSIKLNYFSRLLHPLKLNSNFASICFDHIHLEHQEKFPLDSNSASSLLKSLQSSLGDHLKKTGYIDVDEFSFNNITILKLSGEEKSPVLLFDEYNPTDSARTIVILLLGDPCTLNLQSHRHPNNSQNAELSNGSLAISVGRSFKHYKHYIMPDSNAELSYCIIFKNF